MKLLTTFLCVLTVAVNTYGQAPSNPKPAPATKDTDAPSDSIAVLAGAGDTASCDDLAGAQATTKLLDNISGTVFAAGDLAYPDGSDEQFVLRRCGIRTATTPANGTSSS
jgi:hypothetical protein